MKKFKNFDEYIQIVSVAQKNKLNNINCYLMPDEIKSLINAEKLSYLCNENTLQLVVENQRYCKIYFYGNLDFEFIPFKTDKPILTDLAYSNVKTPNFLNLQNKFADLGFCINSSVTRMDCNNFDNYNCKETQFIVDKLQKEEIDEVYNLWEENFDFVESLLYGKDEIINLLNQIYVLKDKQNHIYGAMELIINNNVAWIQKIAIKKAYQGKGLGAVLENFCLNKCKTLGIKKILLYTVDSNLNAQSFHKKFGFKPDGKFNCQYIKRR